MSCLFSLPTVRPWHALFKLANFNPLFIASHENQMHTCSVGRSLVSASAGWGHSDVKSAKLWEFWTSLCHFSAFHTRSQTSAKSGHFSIPLPFNVDIFCECPPAVGNWLAASLLGYVPRSPPSFGKLFRPPRSPHWRRKFVSMERFL